MKKLLFILLGVIVFNACKKESSISKESLEASPIAAKENNIKIDICHQEGNGTYHTINIAISALPAHITHGDIVPDADGDGFTKTNPCGIGDQDDCDDNNEDIHPGATEVCDNDIDDNCDGEVDENCIQSVTICDQTWMVRNLDVTTYRNGDPIPQVELNADWASLTTGAWCYYNNDPANDPLYGKLYNWYAVNDPRGLAPAGWHIPSDAEWTTLANCLGGAATAGTAMKATTGCTFGSNGDNSSGFTGLVSGIRFTTGAFGNMGSSNTWWSSTESSVNNAWSRGVLCAGAFLGRSALLKKAGASVRCIKD